MFYIYIRVTGLYCICKLFNTIINIDETDVAVRDGFQNNSVLLYFVKRIAWYCDPEFSPNFRKSTKPATLLWIPHGGHCSPTVYRNTRSCPSSTTPSVTTTWRNAPLRSTWRRCVTSCPHSPATVPSVVCLSPGTTIAPTSTAVVREILDLNSIQ